MSGQQQNVWQQNRNNTFRHSNSRTPQNNRSTAASPSLAGPSHPPKSDSHPPPRNVWASKPQERAASGSNGPAINSSNTPSLNSVQMNNNSSFSIEDAKAVLGRKTTVTPYKPAGTATNNKAAAGAGAEVAKMANGQPFFAHLAKQVASLEAGG